MWCDGRTTLKFRQFMADALRSQELERIVFYFLIFREKFGREKFGREKFGGEKFVSGERGRVQVGTA